MKKRPRRQSLSEIAGKIRNIAKDSASVFFTAHSENEMKNDQLTAPDVLQALRSCRVIEVQPAERYKSEGRTATGEAVAAVVQILTLETSGKGLRVITVWRIKSR
jgi:DNA-binding LytR/AlgR family response regulator